MLPLDKTFSVGDRVRHFSGYVHNESQLDGFLSELPVVVVVRVVERPVADHLNGGAHYGVTEYELSTGLFAPPHHLFLVEAAAPGPEPEPPVA